MHRHQEIATDDARKPLPIGPILSYYEFKQPMADRLTDEQWRKIVGTDKSPQRPVWNRNYTNMPCEELPRR